MKNNCNFQNLEIGRPLWAFAKKIPLVMKLFIICLFCSIGMVQAVESYAQNARISLKVEEETVADVLKEIEEASEFDFFYNNTQIDLNRRVSVSAQNSDIFTILEDMFAGTKVRYTVLDKKIILSTELADKQQQQQPGNVVKGKVIDAMGEPVIGATVKEVGTNNGIVTDIDGNFSLAVQPGASLEISFVGYKTETVKAVAGKSLAVTLKEDNELLDEVVVFGYGVQKKKDVTGAITSVNNEAIVKASTPTVSQALRGQVAGLSINQTSGRTGDNFSFQIRGESSIGKSVSPLVVIDGVQASTDALTALNPNDIESVDVLKDASATAIYGSKGSAGVIIVVTKGGNQGKNVISYEGNVGVRLQRGKPDMMNAQEFAQFVEDSRKYYGNSNTAWELTEREKEYVASGGSTDWIDLLSGTGFQTSHSISLSGGNEKETHYMSLGYTNEKGNLQPDEFNRYSLSAKVTGKVADKVQLGASLTAAYRDHVQQNGEILRGAFRLRPTGEAYDENGELQFWPTSNDSQIPNVLFERDNSAQEQETFSAYGSAFIEYEPIKGLIFKSNLMPEYSGQSKGSFTGRYTKANIGTKPATASINELRKLAYTWDNTVSYAKTFNRDHTLNLLGLFSMMSSTIKGHNSSVRGIAFEEGKWNNLGAATDLTGISSSLTKETMISYMARLSYSYKDRYLLTATGRADGSSKFAEGHKWGFFPSIALAWRMSEEDFIRNIEQISNLKLRVSYGVSGNNVVDPYSSWETLSKLSYDFGGTAVAGYSPNIANKELKWEKSKEFNVGIDFGMFNNRLSATAEFYNKKTVDLILSRAIPVHQGFSSLVDNVGSVLNRGFEFTLNTVNIKTKDWTWTTNLNFSINRNKILELYGDQTDDIGNKWFIGHPVKVNYDYHFIGIYQENDVIDVEGAKPGQPHVEDIPDENGVKDGQITSDKDRIILGTPYPKWIGGMTNTIQYKNFDLSIFVYTRQGEQKLSNFHTTHCSDFNGRYNILNVPYYTPDRPSNRWWAPGKAGGNSSYKNASHYYDCSFVRVGNITLGYEFGKKALDYMGLSRLRLYLTAINPFLFTKYDGIDPEWAETSVTSNGLASTTLLFGINLSL